MPRDLHSQDPMAGSTRPVPSMQWEAGLTLCSLAIQSGLSFEETRELLEMTGIKQAA